VAALLGRLGDAAADAEPLCQQAEGGGGAAASAHRQRDGQSSRLCRSCAEGTRILCRQRADRRRYPDELCRRDGEGVRQARALSELERLAVAHARAAGIPAQRREGWGVPVREVGGGWTRARFLLPPPLRGRVGEGGGHKHCAWRPLPARGRGVSASLRGQSLATTPSPPYLA